MRWGEQDLRAWDITTNEGEGERGTNCPSHGASLGGSFVLGLGRQLEYGLL